MSVQLAAGTPGPTSRGERFREEVLRDLEPTDPGAMALLDAACRTMDELQAMEADVRERGVTIIGARGQPIAHPNLASITRHRATLSRLLADLLPEARETQLEQQRRAGRARWGR